MADLVIPNKQHQYVVGIDFGHGETSAAICELQWEAKAGQANIDARDVRINDRNTGNEKVLVSAISIIDGEQPQIGENAFEAGQLDGGAAIRVCFKQPPQDIEGEAEQLMIKYMETVYKKIREMESELNDNNHVVYIARPSGWVEEDVKERYRQMALKAGIPLAGLTSESRAAIFYAQNAPNIGFSRQIEQGAIVFDLGSSTLDFTYLAKDDEPIDYGYPLGASIIDKTIYQDKMLSNEKVKMLLENNPQYTDAFLFRARQIKEEIYKKSDGSEIDESFLLGTIISRNCPDYSQVKRDFVEIEYSNVDDLNQTLEKETQYLTKLKEALNDFKYNHIPAKSINAVFLTGGASRMKFVQDLIRESYGLDDKQVRVDPDNPSLTISRGIAMLGRADSISDELVKNLTKSIQNKDISSIYSQFIADLSSEIGSGAWRVVESELKKFKDSNTDLCVNDLERSIRQAIKNYGANNLQKIISDAIQRTVSTSSENIRKELNKIIELYAPGRELKPIKKSQLQVQTEAIEQQINKIANAIVDNITEQVTSNVGEIVSTIFWSAFWTVLFGVYYFAYLALKWGWNKLTKTEKERKAEEAKLEREKKAEAKAKKLDKSTRQDCYQQIMQEANTTKTSLTEGIKTNLQYNRQLRSTLEPQIKKYSTEFVSQNINSVRIPIE